MVSLKRLLTALLFSALLPVAAMAGDFAGASAQEMIACKTSDECIIATGTCGEWTAINKNAEADYNDMITKTRAVIECTPPQASPKPDAECSDNRCEVK